MIDAGILTPEDQIELLDGILVKKMSKQSPHWVATVQTRDALMAVLPTGWHVQVQDQLTLDDSEPEPDLAVVRGKARDYPTGHPGPADVALVVEVTEAALRRDREWKRRNYARNSIPVYWIAYFADGLLEVFADPSGPAPMPDYATARSLAPADGVDVVIAGAPVGTVPAADLFP